ncbi:MAG: thioredoxin domain-containing protein, partial [Cyclobacteriaceae bacterium]|nr:thioredoxin domain-containing protein [Cyclobacteriaceae bacterium]
QMAYGGLYDQLGGGFARYSVDREWFAPHFEKMLYDNAQLLSLYSEAYRISPDSEFKHVVYETARWLEREMTHQEGGFYSALDADSEGMEGKFYTWTQQELSELLGDKAPVFSEYYQVTANGNWEHGRNILHRSLTSENKITESILTLCKQQLMTEREKRIRPGLDDKILTGWNAMTITGLVDAYHAFHDSWFLDLALQNIRFLEQHLVDEHRCYRTFKDKRNSTEGFLEDYAFLINAYISLYQATFDEGWIQKAEHWSSYVLENFWDDQEGYFFFSGKGAEKLIANKKEIFDNVIPASNSVMARNLFLLEILMDNDDFREKAQRMVTSLKYLIVSEPSYNSNWAILAMDIHMPFAEIAIVGKDALSIKNEMIQQSIPPAVFMGSVGSSNLPLLKDKPATKVTTIYVCYNKTCQLPVTSVAEALKLLRYP